MIIEDKMKTHILIFTILFLISCKPNHKPALTLMYDNNFEALSGKVKQIIEIKNGSNPGDTVIVDFDLQGNITQITTNGLGNTLIRYEYIYNKNGKKTDAILRYYEKWEAYKKCRKQWRHKYDRDGRISEYISDTKMLRKHTNQPMQTKNFFKYNADSDLVQIDHFLDAEHQSTFKYKYNDKHLLIEASLFLRVGYPAGKSVYKYHSIDKNGNWLKRTTTYGSTNVDTILRKITYY